MLGNPATSTYSLERNPSDVLSRCNPAVDKFIMDIGLRSNTAFARRCSGSSYKLPIMEQPKLLMSKEDFKARFDEIHVEHEKLKLEYADNPERLNEIDKEMKKKSNETFGDWERFKSIDMLSEARKYNIDLPSIEDKDAWEGLDFQFGLPFLSNNGKLKMRRAIDEEKIRRREVAAWWWKTVIIPALAAATGLVGALTGLFAVLHHK
jgi:hypothetical protein